MNGSPLGERALFCSLPPAQSSCHGQDLLGRQPPVEEAGQGLSKDKGTFWCADRQTGQTTGVCVRAFVCVCDRKTERGGFGSGVLCVCSWIQEFCSCVFLHVCSQQLGRCE